MCGHCCCCCFTLHSTQLYFAPRPLLTDTKNSSRSREQRLFCVSLSFKCEKYGSLAQEIGVSARNNAATAACRRPAVDSAHGTSGFGRKLVLEGRENRRGCSPVICPLHGGASRKLIFHIHTDCFRLLSVQVMVDCINYRSLSLEGCENCVSRIRTSREIFAFVFDVCCALVNKLLFSILIQFVDCNGNDSEVEFRDMSQYNN